MYCFRPIEENKVEVPEPPNSSFTGAESSTMKYVSLRVCLMFLSTSMGWLWEINSV